MTDQCHSSTLSVNVHDSLSIKRLNRCSFNERMAENKPLLLFKKKNNLNTELKEGVLFSIDPWSQTAHNVLGTLCTHLY